MSGVRWEWELARGAWDRAVWGWVNWVVEAVRFEPRRFDLALACGTHQTTAVAPVARWLVGVRERPTVVELGRLPHRLVRWAATYAGRWLGPTSSVLLRWSAGVVAGVTDRAAGAAIERLLATHPHPGLLVPHVHEVAILAADMRGFSRLTAELRDTERLTELIGDYLTRLTAVIEAGRGVVFQYTGDGLLAVFLPELVGGEPSTILSRLADEIAPALHDEFRAFHVAWGSAGKLPEVPLGLGVGVSVGRATIGYLGPLGKKQMGVIGEPVNMAAFLCAQARAGAVLIDRASFTRAGLEPPPVKIERLRSKKAHQRVDVVCLRGRSRGPAGLRGLVGAPRLIGR